MIHDIDHGIKKRNVMRHKNKRVFISLQQVFKPCDVLLIQKVRGLVQNENHRILQKQLCKQYLCALPSAELANVLIKAYFTKTETVCILLYTGIQHIEAAVIKHFLNLADFLHQLCHFLIT